MSKTLEEVYAEVFGEFVGYAVEAGAFDGVFVSTTLYLEVNDWKVLLVEPVPEIFSRLLENRVNDFCYCYALGSENKDNVPFTVFPDLNGGASISSLSPDKRILKDWNGDGSLRSEDIFVKQRTLDYCLELAGFPRVDLLSLDVEGGELEVLKGFDIGKWAPKLIVIENIYEDTCLRDYLLSYNYKLINRLDYNDIFLREM